MMNIKIARQHFMVIKTACLLALLFFTMQAIAVVPEAIKYQAVARDNNGNIIANRNIGIRLSILETTTSGISVYSERHAAVTNNLGLVNLEIGKGTALSGSMTDIDWGNDSHFIKIEMDDNGGTNYTMVGTSQLVSVPYALYAKEAANGTQWSDTTDNIYFNTGKVGVGTNNPKTAFEVFSHAKKGSQVLITGELPTLRLIDTAYSGNGVIIGVAADSNDLIPRSGKGDVVFTNEAYGTGGGYIFGTGVPSEPCVKITDDCKVGIGTDKPVAKLDVSGGDINIADVGSGVVMKSPDGNCWRMTVSNTGQPVFTSIQCLTSIQPTITPTQWNLHYWEGSAGNHLYYTPSNFIKNGTANFGSLPHTSGHWFVQYDLPVPPEINLDLDNDSLRIVASVRNINGDGTSNEINLGIGSDTVCYATWQDISVQPGYLYFCQINIGSQKTVNISEHSINPSIYAQYAFQLQKTNIQTFKDNVLLKTITGTNYRGGRVKEVHITFRGYGEVDWVKLYKGNKLIMSEDFNTNGTTSAVWTMP